MSKNSSKKPSVSFLKSKKVNVSKHDPDLEKKEESKKNQPKEEKENKKRPASSASITHALEIMKEIDPNQTLNKNEIVAVLNKRLDDISEINLLEFDAISYLLYRFDNLEEKLVELEDTREKQEHKIYSGQKHLSNDNFKEKISLNSDEKPEMDETLRILEQSKQYYSTNSKYIKPTIGQENMFKSLNTLKKVNISKLKELYRV